MVAWKAWVEMNPDPNFDIARLERLGSGPTNRETRAGEHGSKKLTSKIRFSLVVRGQQQDTQAREQNNR